MRAMRLALSMFLLTAALAADLNSRLAEWRPVRMPFDRAGLTTRQQQVVLTLVEACRHLERIYWEQSDPKGLDLFRTAKDARIKRLLAINGSRFDLLDDNKPFTGSDPFLPGRAIFPPGLTRRQIEDYVAKHPQQKTAIYDPLTVLRWKDGKAGTTLEAIPYHVAYRQELEPAAELLRKAAALSDDAGFAGFLKLRATALLNDDYYASEAAWVDLKNPKIDLIYAPEETYLDDVLGVKASWGGAVLVRNEEESRKLALYEKYVPAIQNALPIGAADKPSKEGQPTPMEVVDAPFRAGDLRHGYQAVADNLPNDPRIHAAKGTKKIFFKNFMDARVRYVVLPLAKQVLEPAQAAGASAEGYLAAVVMHEICHGLGPVFSTVNGKKEDIRAAIGPAYSGLEEAKADVTGMFALQWMIDHGALPKDREREYYDSYVAGIFRTVRYGIAEAHGRAEMMEFNFLSERKAIVRNPDGLYAIDYALMPGAIAAVTKELLEIEATGDRARAESWFARYDRMPTELAAALKKVTGVPVDVDPTFDFPDL